jgi:CHAD domain-containing protein
MSGPVPRSNLLKYCLGRFTRVLSGVQSGDVRSLHRARVASRRLRELVPVLQLDSDATRKLSRRLRKVTKRLGTVRELDVMLALVDELRESQPIHHDALRRARAAVAEARDEARNRLFDHLPADEMRRTARKLSRVLVELRQAEGARSTRRHPVHAKTAAWAIDARVANRATRLAAAVEEAGAVYLPERLHVVRIAEKKLRYALELAIAAGRNQEKMPAVGVLKSRKSSLRMLKRVQETLGRMHDLQVLIDHVREVQASLTPPSLTAWRELDALVIALDESCRRLHAKYVRDRAAIQAVTERLRGSPRTASRATVSPERHTAAERQARVRQMSSEHQASVRRAK